MRGPIVHNDTWTRVRTLATRAGEPEWKVLHLAVLLLEQRVGERPEVLDALVTMEGDLGAGFAAPFEGGE